MRLVYSDHSIRSMKKRGISELEVEHIIAYPSYVRDSYDDKKEATGTIRNRTITIIFIPKESYIRIITII